jgi:hypothetical protein
MKNTLCGKSFNGLGGSPVIPTYGEKGHMVTGD